MPAIDLTGVGALVSALTGLLVAAGSVLLQRQRRSAVDADEMEDELEVRTRQYQAALRYIRTLEDDRANQGLPTLRRPAELRPGYFQARQGRRRRGDAGDTADESPEQTTGRA
jgi:hypothetical protein